MNILPAVEELCRRGEDVSCFLYYRMASTAQWPKTSPDPVPLIRQRLDGCRARIIGDIEEGGIRLAREISQVSLQHNFDLAVLDANKGKLHWGTPVLYSELRRRGVPVIGCQEGSVDDGEAGLKPIAEGLGINYDYCFCLGEFDQEFLLRRNPHLGDRLYAVGLPGNDGLNAYRKLRTRRLEHVMLVPSWTESAGKTSRFEPMTTTLTDSCGLQDLCKHYRLPLLIKEKTRSQFAFKHLEGSDVKVTMDETQLDELVSKSVCVIGAPSTLLFKSIQLGIPTAVLGRPVMGQLGVFREFPGLTDSTKESVIRTILSQERSGRIGKEFIERAVCGGSDFTSTQRFVDAIYTIACSATHYEGPLMKTMGWRKGLAQRFPKSYFLFRSLLGKA